jgi:hypothetical protein
LFSFPIFASCLRHFPYFSFHWLSITTLKHKVT